MNKFDRSVYSNKEVLEFYRELPFNFYSSVEKQADSVKNGKKNILANGPLEKEIKKSKKIIDVGCGAGFLSNTISYLHPDKLVYGIDFNDIAINRAKSVSKKLNLSSKFETADLFKFFPKVKFNLVISIGVLMHTNNCFEGLNSIIDNMLDQDGQIYIGLYHLYGRKPFLDYFKNLEKKGFSEEEQIKEYSNFHSNLKDQVHLKSWFRDQVHHPHEQQFSLEQVVNHLRKKNFIITCTSINKFENLKFDDQDEYNENELKNLFNLEKKYEQIGLNALDEKRYFPGFFTFFARKRRIND